MDQSLPLFPLTTALVPGLVLPLHIFEPRYRMMVQELLGKPEDEREFGIVALRESHTLTPKQSSPGDVPDDDASPIDPSAEDAELYPVGVSAVIRQAERGDVGSSTLIERLPSCAPQLPFFPSQRSIPKIRGWRLRSSRRCRPSTPTAPFWAVG